MFFNIHLDIPLNNKQIQIFMERGFSPKANKATPYHKHSYTEIHMVAEGSMVLNIENKNYTLRSGDIIMLPSRTYHTIVENSDNLYHSAFQINSDYKNEIVLRQISPAILNEFFSEINKCNNPDSNFSMVAAYIPIILTTLMDSTHVSAQENTDYAYIIHEFFSENYNNDDIKVSHLAEKIHLSAKQTQLLVKRHTGNTFKQELAVHRMKIANHMIANTDLPLSEIASKVGFQTYSGFWKMYRNYQEKLDKNKNCSD